METFGQKLRQAIHRRGLSLDDVARQTGFDLHHLAALARDDHGVLPEDGSVAQGLRGLARLLEVDPDQVVEDYLRARENHEQWDPPSSGPSRAYEPPGEPASLPVVRSDRSPRFIAIGVAVLVLAVSGVFWLRPAARGEARPAEPAQTAAEPAVPETSVPEAAPVPSPSASAPRREAVKVPQRPEPPAPEPAVDSDPSGGLAIRHHGVGKGVRRHELVGQADRFAEGTSVWFWTLVEGAQPGEEIEHVWLHEGEEMLRVPMTIGGARWRMHSYKNMHPGSAGGWVVEARDRQGRVLASTGFECFSRAGG